ncbi:MAG: hypothetical protein ACMG6H_05800, partial [Acidobacteriota bacterium]
FWNAFGKKVYDDTKSGLKIRDEIRQLTTAALGDAATDEQKLQKLLTFVRTKIKNTDSDTSGLTPADRAKLKENKSPVDTLKRGMGTESDINLLFGAMAAAAGFDVRMVRVGNRNKAFFSTRLTVPYFLSSYDIAVKIGSAWRIIDPSSPYVPLDMLLWQEEGEQALVTDPKESTFVKTPMSSPEKSLEKRTAKLKVTEDGTIEGDVRIEYSGHLGIDLKNLNDDDSPEQREQNLRDKIKERMSTAEISQIRIENVTDPDKPFVYAYHIRVPGYAQRTGKRLFLQPGFFEHGKGPLFSASERKYEIYFHYPWSEQDDVTIELPPGFALDNADQPAPFGSPPVTQYRVTMGITKDGRTLIYRRNFFFGGGDQILFPANTYAALKQLFDAVNTADNHTITFKLSETSSQ